MTNCLTWLLARAIGTVGYLHKNEQAKIYVGNASRSTSSIPTNTFSRKNLTHYTRSEKRDRRESKNKKATLRCVSKKEPNTITWPVDSP